MFALLSIVLSTIPQLQADTLPQIFSLSGPNESSTHTFSPREVTVIRWPSSSAPNLNAIAKIPTLSTDDMYNHFAVGDQGKVLKIKVTPWMNQILISSEMTIYPEYNFTGVSFANENVGWIVGYKRDNPDKWRGIILRTIDGGDTWSPQTSPSFPGNIQVPFLKVEAVDIETGWISCGNGYVLRTTNGGYTWRRTHKPLGEDHFGWFWGLHVIDSDNAWVCSDQTGLVAKTINGGDDWTCKKPGWEISPQDTSLVFNDLDSPEGFPDLIYISASNGKVVFTTNGGNSWDKYYPFHNTKSNCFFGVRCLFNDITPFVCGNYGIIVRNGLLHWWNDIELKDFSLKSIGGYVKSDGSNYIIAVGEGSGIVFSCDSLQVISIVEVRGYDGTVTPPWIEFDLYNPTGASYQNYPITWWWSRIGVDYGYGKQPRFFSPILAECDIPSGPGIFTFWYPFLDPYPYLYDERLYFLITRRDKGHHTSPNIAHARYFEYGPPPPIPNRVENLEVIDAENDHGGIVRANWNPPAQGNADFYVVNIRHGGYNGGLIGTTTNLYEYLPCPDGVDERYYVRTARLEEEVELFSSPEVTDWITSLDNVPPPEIQLLTGDYCSELDACTLKWNPISSASEPNLSGYWVCPVISGLDARINHPAPIQRNYYIEKVPEGFPRGDSWGFEVQAMDRSGNRYPWQGNYYFVYIPGRTTSTSPYATAFNQGRHLVRVPETKTLHLVYETNGKVMHSYSLNNGEQWSEEALGNGYFPSIGVDQKGLPWIAFLRDCDIVCKVKKSDGAWKERIVYDGNDTCWAGAPAIALGTIPDGVSPAPFAYITYPVYEGEGMPDMPAPGPHPSYYNCIKLSILDTVNIAHYSIDEGDADCPVCDPAIAVTPADLIHLVWQKGDEIYYTTNYDKISYDNFQQAQIQEKMNLSESPGVRSQHPFIESYGDRVFAAWKEGDPGEIYRRVRTITPGGITWQDPENISNSPSQESDYPVLATSDVVAYQEKVDDTNYEIYTWINGDLVNLSETDNPSKFPHILVEPPKPHEPEVLIDAIWTETITEDMLYEVKFKQYRHPINPDGFGEYISVTIGDSVASKYCEQRDGYIDYGEFSCDYDNSSLIYTIPYLNPVSNYLLRAVVYKEGSQSGKEEVYVDTTFVTEVSYAPYIPETVYILLPRETYANDFEVGKEIEKILGNYALLADLKVYEVSLPDSGGGGAQSAGSSRITRTVLYQNNPNPFKELTKIAFALPKESKVSLFVYNVTGRRVRTLIDEKMKPGNYNLKWDGKDNQNRNLGQGIYFYRLQTEDFKDTKKTVLLK
jgi:photosystem II stability/assembly factor-like uncharacterized protein